ncbi:MAG: acyloxyacyl hydrolase [Bermanella sp.]
MIRIFALLSIFIVTPSVLAAGDTLKSDPKETWGWRTAMITSLMLTLGTNPLGADEYNITPMSSTDVAGLKLGFRWHPGDVIGHLAGSEITHYYLFAYNYWQSTVVDGQEGVVNGLEFIPVFRLNWSYSNLLSFVETSVGASVLSQTQINDRQLSTNFQFSNSLAFGGYFTPQSTWTLQLQHYSNNSIKLPNNGINFYNLNFAFRY